MTPLPKPILITDDQQDNIIMDEVVEVDDGDVGCWGDTGDVNNSHCSTVVTTSNLNREEEKEKNSSSAVATNNYGACAAEHDNSNDDDDDKEKQQRQQDAEEEEEDHHKKDNNKEEDDSKRDGLFVDPLRHLFQPSSPSSPWLSPSLKIHPRSNCSSNDETRDDVLPNSSSSSSSNSSEEYHLKNTKNEEPSHQPLLLPQTPVPPTAKAEEEETETETEHSTSPSSGRMSSDNTKNHQTNSNIPTTPVPETQQAAGAVRTSPAAPRNTGAVTPPKTTTTTEADGSFALKLRNHFGKGDTGSQRKKKKQPQSRYYTCQKDRKRSLFGKNFNDDDFDDDDGSECFDEDDDGGDGDDLLTPRTKRKQKQKFSLMSALSLTPPRAPRGIIGNDRMDELNAMVLPPHNDDGRGDQSQRPEEEGEDETKKKIHTRSLQQQQQQGERRRWNRNSNSDHSTSTTTKRRRNRQRQSGKRTKQQRWLISSDSKFKIGWDVCTILLSIISAYTTHQSIRDRSFDYYNDVFDVVEHSYSTSAAEEEDFFADVFDVVGSGNTYSSSCGYVSCGVEGGGGEEKMPASSSSPSSSNNHHQQQQQKHHRNNNNDEDNNNNSNSKHNTARSFFAMFIEIWFVIDMLLNFVVEHKTITGKVIKDKRAVWARYLTSWFVIDLLSLVPWESLYIQPIIEMQKERNIFQKSFFRTKAVVRVTRKLRGKHFRLFFQASNKVTKPMMGFGSKRLLGLLIKYIPKYVMFYRNMKGVLLIRVLRFIHWIRKIIKNFFVATKKVTTTATAAGRSNRSRSYTDEADGDNNSNNKRDSPYFTSRRSELRKRRHILQRRNTIAKLRRTFLAGYDNGANGDDLDARSTTNSTGDDDNDDDGDDVDTNSNISSSSAADDYNYEEDDDDNSIIDDDDGNNSSNNIIKRTISSNSDSRGHLLNLNHDPHHKYDFIDPFVDQIYD